VGLPHFFSKQLSGLWPIAAWTQPISTSLGRFWVGLTTKVPAHTRKNFKHIKPSKTSKIPFGRKEKLWERVDFYMEIFSLKSKSYFNKSSFSRVKAREVKMKTLLALTLE
jgi:hypothetical protein